jgi:integrase
MAQIRQTGTSSWLCRVRLRGHPEVTRTFPTEREARAFARTTEKALRQGQAISGLPERGERVEDAIRAFRELREEGGRGVDPESNEEYMLRHLEEGLGRVPVAGLHPARLSSWAAGRATDGAGPYTVGMELSKLRTVLKYAAVRLRASWGDPVGAALPTLTYAGLVGPGKHRDRRPSAAELEAVLDRLDPLTQDVVWFAIGTAMRRGEITRILWRDVDEARRLVLVRNRKHPRKTKGNNVWVPLTAHTGVDAWAVLQRQARVGDRIFELEDEQVSDRFLAACDGAGVKDLHFHDLRHEATSRLFEAGLPIERVALVTGHADWRNLRRYTNLKPELLTMG